MVVLNVVVVVAVVVVVVVDVVAVVVVVVVVTGQSSHINGQSSISCGIENGAKQYFRSKGMTPQSSWSLILLYGPTLLALPCLQWASVQTAGLASSFGKV